MPMGGLAARERRRERRESIGNTISRIAIYHRAGWQGEGRFLGLYCGRLEVFRGGMVGLLGSAGMSPSKKVVCFQQLLGYSHHFGPLEAILGPLAGGCHLGRWQRLAPRRGGGSKSKGLVLLDAEQALTLSLYQVVKERMAVMGVNLLILCEIECCDWRGLTPAAGSAMMRVCSM